MVMAATLNRVAAWPRAAARAARGCRCEACVSAVRGCLRTGCCGGGEASAACVCVDVVGWSPAGQRVLSHFVVAKSLARASAARPPTNKDQLHLKHPIPADRDVFGGFLREQQSSAGGAQC